jgi:hypothetical protein
MNLALVLASVSEALGGSKFTDAKNQTGSKHITLYWHSMLPDHHIGTHPERYGGP